MLFFFAMHSFRFLCLFALSTITAGPADSEAESQKALAAQTAAFNDWIDARARLRGAKGASPAAACRDSPDARRVPLRIGELGPLTYQNDNVLLARLGKERYSKIKLLNSEATPLLNVQDQSELYAYEIVNFVNGKRTVGEIRDAVSAEYGPLPLSLVTGLPRSLRRGQGDRLEVRRPHFYFPMQNDPKIKFRMSSAVVAPVISSSGRSAL